MVTTGDGGADFPWAISGHIIIYEWIANQEALPMMWRCEGGSVGAINISREVDTTLKSNGGSSNACPRCPKIV